MQRLMHRFDASPLTPATRRRVGARALALAGLVGVLLASGPAGAQERTQWDVGLATGICGLGTNGALWQETRWCSAARGDVLFGRDSERSYGYGPYASVATASFDDLRIGAGGSVLLPVLPTWPIVLSGGGLLRTGTGRTQVGAEGWLFWGGRGMNFHGTYNLAHGLLLGFQRTFDDQADSAVWLMGQVDAVWLAMPFIFLINAAS